MCCFSFVTSTDLLVYFQSFTLQVYDYISIQNIISHYWTLKQQGPAQCRRFLLLSTVSFGLLSLSFSDVTDS